MKKTSYFTLIFLAILTTNVFSCADKTDPNFTEEDLKKIRLCFGRQVFSDEQLEAIHALILASHSREIPSENSPGARDYGYDFSKKDMLNTTLLIMINSFPKESPICYDLGAGYGEASRNMVLAGGQVTYVEHHLDVAKIAQKEVCGALKKIASSPAQKKDFWGRLRMIRRDFLETTNLSTYPEGLQIDICNLGNVLHFLTPTQLDTFLPALLEKMAPGGFIFASVHVPLDSPKVLEYFFEQKALGNLYPGYFRYIRHYERDGNVPTETSLSLKEIKDEHDAEAAVEGDLPGSIISRTLLPEGSRLPETMTVKSSVHFFDPDVARGAFERAGFNVIRSVFTNMYGEFLEDVAATKELLLSGNFHLALIAQKEETPS